MSSVMTCLKCLLSLYMGKDMHVILIPMRIFKYLFNIPNVDLKMVSFIRGFLVFFIVDMSATEKNIFRKFTSYPEQNNLLFSHNIESKLLCFSACLKIKSCSMIIMIMGPGNKSSHCKVYSLRNLNNISLVYEPETEIWYKREVFMAMLDVINSKTTENIFQTTKGADVTTPVTTQNPCINGFTFLTTGCYNVSDNWDKDWDGAAAYCDGGSTFATISSLTVRNLGTFPFNL